MGGAAPGTVLALPGGVRRCLTILFLSSLTACSSAVTDGGGGAAVEDTLITQGARDERTRGVVALVVNGNKLASAVLVAPGVVLTAAHAVHPSFIGRRVYSAGVSAETDVVIGTTRLVGIRPENIHVHPEFDAKRVMAGHDLAVLVLSADALPGVTPLEIDRALDDTVYGSPVRVVGYGVYARSDASSSGTRRTAATVLGPANEQLLQVGGEGSPQACVGDSGGPTLVARDGAERVLSLASFITKDDVRCLKGNYNTRIDANLEFLAPYLPAPPAPADLGTDLGAPMDASGADG
jgi:hypothetical protein